MALAVGLAVFAATALYTFTRPKIYEATASVPLEKIIFPHRGEPIVSTSERERSYAIRCGIDPNLYVTVGRSELISRRVAAQLNAADLLAFQQSHRQPLSLDANRDALAGALREHLIVSVSSDATTLRLHCTFRLRSPEASARFADAFATRVVEYLQIHSSDHRNEAISDLKQRTAQQRAKVAALETAAGVTPHAVRELQINQEFLRQLDARVREVENEPTLPAVAIIPAEVPDSPVSPNIPLHLGAGLLAALALGPLASAIAARRASPAHPT